MLIWKLSPRATQYTILHCFGIHNRKLGKKKPGQNNPEKVALLRNLIFCKTLLIFGQNLPTSSNISANLSKLNWTNRQTLLTFKQIVTKSTQKVEIGENCKVVYCVDLVKSFQTLRSFVHIFIFSLWHVFLACPIFLNPSVDQDPYSNKCLLAKIGVDTADNEPLEVWRWFNSSIHSPP